MCDSESMNLTDGVTDDSWTDVTGSDNTSQDISGLSQEGTEPTNCSQDIDHIKNSVAADEHVDEKEDKSQDPTEQKIYEPEKDCKEEINDETIFLENKISNMQINYDAKSEINNENSILIDEKETEHHNLKTENSQVINNEKQKDNQLVSPSNTEVNTAIDNDKNDKLDIDTKVEIPKNYELDIEKNDIEYKENFQDDNESNITMESNEIKPHEKEDCKISSKFKATEIVIKNGALSPTKIEELVPNLEWKQSQ